MENEATGDDAHSEILKSVGEKVLAELRSRNMALEDKIKQLETDKPSLQEELDMTKLEYEELKSRLLESTIMNNNNLKEIQRLQQENAHLRRTPLFIASVIEIIDGDMVLLRQPGNNQEVLTKPSAEILHKLKPGALVSVNDSLSIVKIIHDQPIDQRVSSMEVIEAPVVYEQDIGGLDSIINELSELLDPGKIVDPEKYERVGIKRPNKILLYGAPGTGKTSILKMLCHDYYGYSFFRLSGFDHSDILMNDTGLIHRLFQAALKKAPSMIFFDDLNAYTPNITKDGFAKNDYINIALSRLLSEFEWEEYSGSVRLIAATNNINAIDPSFLHPSKFDKVIELPVPDDKGREAIFNIHTRRMTLGQDVNVPHFVACTEGATGAEIKAITTQAGMLAVKRGDESINQGDIEEAIKCIFHKNVT